MSFLSTAYVSPYPITGRLHRLYDQKRVESVKEVSVYDYRANSGASAVFSFNSIEGGKRCPTVAMRVY